MRVDGYEYRLSRQMELTYSICHAAKHFAGYGCGVRMILDIAVMTNAWKGCLDFKALEAELKSDGMLEFAWWMWALIEKWFDVSCPLTPESVDTRGD